MIKKTIFISIILLTTYSFTLFNKLETVAVFEIHKGLPVIDVNINGFDAKLILDTGATSSVLNSNMADEYMYECNMYEGYYTRGISGVTNMGIVNGVDLFIDGNYTESNFKCVDFDEISKRMNVLGILGSDFFIRNNLIIDYENKKIKKRL